MKRCKGRTHWGVTLLLLVCIGYGMLNAQDNGSMKDLQRLEKTSSTLTTVGLVLALTAVAIPLICAAVKSNSSNEKKNEAIENRTDSLSQTENERNLQ
jgi:ABC-type sulfate transport system permease component